MVPHSGVSHLVENMADTKETPVQQPKRRDLSSWTLIRHSTPPISHMVYPSAYLYITYILYYLGAGTFSSAISSLDLRL